MKVLCTGLFPFWQCHFVAECNFIEEHLTAGDDVDVLTCEASLLACDANPKLQLPNCLTCIGIRESAVSLLSKPINKRMLVSASAIAMLKNLRLPHFQCMEDLKAFSIHGTCVGADVVSSIMTAVGDPNFDVVKNSKKIKKTIRDYLGVYLTALEYLNGGDYSLVYIFNGRFASAKAWIRACEQTNTDYYTMERLGMPDRVLKIKNGTVHGFSSYAAWISEFWNKNKGVEDVRKEAVDFFEERPNGLLKGWNSFIKSQDRERLPAGWDSSKLNMGVFSSTDTEFAGIPEVFDGALYADQQSCYLRIAQILKEKDSSIHLYLRIHPNSKSEKNYWWDHEDFQNISNLTVIPPDSPISSYQLMNSCEKTIVFMTTMGIEASYWGKPSILLSNSPYKGIGAVYEPDSESAAIQLICQRDLEAKPREAALAYGGYRRMGAPTLPYSEPLDHCTLTFKGVRPNATQKVLKYYWRWHSTVKSLPLPQFLKSAWCRIEWLRLKKIY